MHKHQKLFTEKILYHSLKSSNVKGRLPPAVMAFTVKCDILEGNV